MEYFVHIAILIAIYIILAQSYNLPFGLGGFLTLAHIAFYALGAYTTALLSTEQAASFLVCVSLSIVVGIVCSLVVGAIALRLRHDYFAIGSLAFYALIQALLINWKGLTRGVLGIPGIGRPQVFGRTLDSNFELFFLVYTILLLSLAFMYLVFRSPYARSLRMQAENPLAAQALGRNVTWVRIISFVISACFASLAGSLFAYFINYIDPSSFVLSEMVFVLTVVVIGRPGSFWGVIAATVFLITLPEAIRFIYDIPPSILGPARQMLYALILFGMVYWKRRTIFPVRRSV